MSVYYVKNGGSDSASGLTDATAWATVKKARDMVISGAVGVGDSILLKRGDEFYGSFHNLPVVTATTGRRLVIGAYGTGNRPKSPISPRRCPLFLCRWPRLRRSPRATTTARRRAAQRQPARKGSCRRSPSSRRATVC